MGWIWATVLVVLYNITLWMLPVERWKRRTAECVGASLMVPFLILMSWAGSGRGFWSLYLMGFLPWRIARISKLPEEKGFDWLTTTAFLLGIGIIGYLYVTGQIEW